MLSDKTTKPDYFVLGKTKFWNELINNEEIKKAFDKGFRDLNGMQALGVVLLMVIHQMEREWLGAVVDPDECRTFKIPPRNRVLQEGVYRKAPIEESQMTYLRDRYASEEFRLVFGSSSLDDEAPAPSLLVGWSDYQIHSEICRIILDITSKSRRGGVVNPQKSINNKLNLLEHSKGLEALERNVKGVREKMRKGVPPVPLSWYTNRSQTSNKNPYQAAIFSCIFTPLSMMTIFDLEFEKDECGYEKYVKNPIENLLYILIEARDSPKPTLRQCTDLNRFWNHTFFMNRHNMLALELIIGHVNSKIQRASTLSEAKKALLKFNVSFNSELKLDTTLTAKDMLFALWKFFDVRGRQIAEKPIVLKREDAHFLLNYLYKLFGWNKPSIQMTRIIELIGDRQDLHKAERHRVSCQQEVRNMLTYLGDLKSRIEAYKFTNQGASSWEGAEIKSLFNNTDGLTKDRLLSVLSGLHESYLARQQLGKDFVLKVFYFEPYYTKEEHEEFTKVMSFRTAILKDTLFPFEHSLIKIFMEGKQEVKP
jgi:hypothetical protein